jgi:hypothetical protein
MSGCKEALRIAKQKRVIVYEKRTVVNIGYNDPIVSRELCSFCSGRRRREGSEAGSADRDRRAGDGVGDCRFLG